MSDAFFMKAGKFKETLSATVFIVNGGDSETVLMRSLTQLPSCHVCICVRVSICLFALTADPITEDYIPAQILNSHSNISRFDGLLGHYFLNSRLHWNRCSVSEPCKSSDIPVTKYSTKPWILSKMVTTHHTQYISISTLQCNYTKPTIKYFQVI